MRVPHVNNVNNVNNVNGVDIKEDCNDRPKEDRHFDLYDVRCKLMGKVIAERMSAQIEGDFVVFLIGMRINKWWKIHRWAPPALAMLRMHRELTTLPAAQTGCMESRVITPGMTVQYWRSFDHLEAYAREKTGLHMPAWKSFNAFAKKARGDVGIWHETFLVEAGGFETLYSGMPEQGLGRAGHLVPATGQMKVARSRLNPTGAPQRSTPS